MSQPAPDVATVIEHVRTAMKALSGSGMLNNAGEIEGINYWGGSAEFTTEPTSGITVSTWLTGDRYFADTDAQSLRGTMTITVTRDTSERPDRQQYDLEIGADNRFRAPLHVQELLDNHLTASMAALPLEAMRVLQEQKVILAARAERYALSAKLKQRAEVAAARLPQKLTEIIGHLQPQEMPSHHLHVKQQRLPSGDVLASQSLRVVARNALMHGGQLNSSGSYHSGDRIVRPVETLGSASAEIIELSDKVALRLAEGYMPIAQPAEQYLSAPYLNVIAFETLKATAPDGTALTESGHQKWKVAYDPKGRLDFERTAPYIAGGEAFDGPQVPQALQGELKLHEIEMINYAHRAELGFHDAITVVDRAISAHMLQTPPLADLHAPAPAVTKPDPALAPPLAPSRPPLS